MKIEAAIARDAESAYSIEPCELTGPAADEILVEVHACGICHTDSTVKTGGLPVKYPVVLGHEGAGIVLEVGQRVTHVSPGDHVVMSFGNCGTCSSCDSGEPAYCDQFPILNLVALNPDADPTHSQNGEVIHGRFFAQSSFATHAISKASNTVRIDPEIPFHLAAPLGCGIQTGAGAVLNVLKPEAHNTIAVFGAGAVGLSALMAAKIINCREIIAIDINADRLEKASELGATMTINAAEVDDVFKLLLGKFPKLIDFVFESTGSPKVAETAFKCIGRRGVGAYVSAPPLGTGFNVDINNLVGMGRTLRGVVEGDSNPSQFIPQLIDYYKRGMLPLDQIVKTFPFQKINEAMDSAKTGEVIKPVLLMK